MSKRNLKNIYLIEKLGAVCFVLLAVMHSPMAFSYTINAKGFLTFAYSISNTEVEYSDSISDDGEYSQGTKAGLQFSSVLSHKVDAFIQTLADGKRDRNFNFALDIAHVNYNFSDKHKILYGKIRLPIWMISDFKQVGSLYPWVNIPEEIYEIVPLQDIGASDTFFGFSFEGSLYQSGLKELQYRVYSGGNERKFEKEDNSGQSVEIKLKNLHGILLDYTHYNWQFKLNYLNVNSEGERFDYETEAYLGEDSFRTEYKTLGIKYDNDYVLFLSEFSQVDGEIKEVEKIESYYLMFGSYFSNNEVLGHITYADVLDSSKSNKDIFQKSITLGLNFDLDLSTVLKFEHKTVILKNRPRKRSGSGDIEPAGLFRTHPNKDITILSASINTMF